MLQSINPYLALLIGVLGVSSSAILVKLTSAPAAIIALYRLLFTFLLLLPFTLKNHREEFKYFSKKQYLIAFISGSFLAFHFISWFLSLNYTSVASSTVLVNTQPIFVIVFSFILWRETPALKSLIGVLVALTGTIILSWGDLHLAKDNLLGDGLALIGAAMVAGYYLCGKYLRQEMNNLSYSSLVYGFSILVLLVFSLFNNYPLVGYSLKDYVVFLCLGIFCTIIGHSVLNWSLKYLPTTSVSISILGEPVIASILAYIIFQENLTIQQLWGSTLILGGIYYFLKVQAMRKTC